MARYIDADKVLQELGDEPLNWTGSDAEIQEQMDYRLFKDIIESQPTADVVEVVRCKDCKHFQPEFVLTNDGERRPYTQEEKESGFGLVSAEKGINCGSRCERFGYWEENKIPVWFNENDFCSYGERRENNAE